MMEEMLSPPLLPLIAEPIPPIELGATGMPVIPPLMPDIVAAARQAKVTTFCDETVVLEEVQQHRKQAEVYRPVWVWHIPTRARVRHRTLAAKPHRLPRVRGEAMFFSGDHRASKRKVDLRGASKGDSRASLLEQTRKDREQRQTHRTNTKAALRIQVRSYSRLPAHRLAPQMRGSPLPKHDLPQRQSQGSTWWCLRRALGTSQHVLDRQALGSPRTLHPEPRSHVRSPPLHRPTRGREDGARHACSRLRCGVHLVGCGAWTQAHAITERGLRFFFAGGVDARAQSFVRARWAVAAARDTLRVQWTARFGEGGEGVTGVVGQRCLRELLFWVRPRLLPAVRCLAAVAASAPAATLPRHQRATLLLLCVQALCYHRYEGTHRAPALPPPAPAPCPSMPLLRQEANSWTRWFLVATLIVAGALPCRSRS
jgi:hypothetical protein